MKKRVITLILAAVLFTGTLQAALSSPQQYDPDEWQTISGTYNSGDGDKKVAALDVPVESLVFVWSRNNKATDENGAEQSGHFYVPTTPSTMENGESPHLTSSLLYNTGINPQVLYLPKGTHDITVRFSQMYWQKIEYSVDYKVVMAPIETKESSSTVPLTLGSSFFGARNGGVTRDGEYGLAYFQNRERKKIPFSVGEPGTVDFSITTFNDGQNASDTESQLYYLYEIFNAADDSLVKEIVIDELNSYDVRESLFLPKGDYYLIVSAMDYGETGGYNYTRFFFLISFPDRLVVSPKTGEVTVGNTLQLTATLNGTPATPDKWEVSGTAATIDSSGLLRGVSAGSVTVTATHGNLTDTAVINVKAGKLTVTPSYEALSVGGEIRYKATYDGQPVTPQWSLKPADIGSINSGGLFKAAKDGNATVTATYNGIKAEAVVDIIPQSLAIVPDSGDLKIGETLELRAVLLNLNVPAVWSVTGGKNFAKVDSSGRLTGTAAGVVTVTANYGGQTATAKFTVKEEAGQLVVTPGSGDLLFEESLQLKAAVNGKAVTPKWSVNDKSLATVSAGGLLKALQKEGTVTVTAELNGSTATAAFRITAGKLVIEQLTPTITDMAVGHRLEFQALYEGEPAQASWHLNTLYGDSIVASIPSYHGGLGGDDKRIVKADSVGQAELIAEYNGVTASFIINVGELEIRPTTGAEWDYMGRMVVPSRDVQLEAYIVFGGFKPEYRVDADFRDLDTSSGEGIPSITEDGHLTIPSPYGGAGYVLASYQLVRYGNIRLPQGFRTFEIITVKDSEDPEATGTTGATAPSGWAQDDVRRAGSRDIVPGILMEKFQNAITRAEFCALAVQLYEQAKGEITGRTKFSDTNDVNVEKAAYIGVVNGVGGGRFNPNGKLNREQAATMLARLAEAIGMPLPDSTPAFSDNGSISGWAFDAVGKVNGAGIMQGIGGGRFSPKGPFTREQSIVTMLRLYDWLMDTSAETEPNTAPETSFEFVGPLPPTSPVASGDPDIKLDKTTYKPGEKIVVTVTGIDSGMIDHEAHVAIYTPGAAADDFGQWKYAPAGEGTLEFTAPAESGRYEMRLYEDTLSPTDMILTKSVAFTVSAAG